MIEAEPGPVVRLAEAFAAQPPGRPGVRLCAAAATLLDAVGVGVSLGASDDLCDSGLQTVWATDGGFEGETLQFDLGEGPSYTAQRTGWPVLVPDLDAGHGDTWPAFARAAAAVGLRAVFAFPLCFGSGGLGVLTLYRYVAGALTSEQYVDALEVAGFALDQLTWRQAERGPDGLQQVFTDGMARTATVSQASGVVSAQLGIPVDAALALLRAHAFAEERSLADVATQVIEHRLTLGPLHH